MTFAMLAVRNLARRPLRAALSAGGVALSVASCVALLGLARGPARAWEQNLTGPGTEILVTRKGAVEVLSTSIDESVSARLAALPGARDVAGELLDLIGLDSGHTVMVSGRPPGCYIWSALEMVDGRLPTPDDAAGEVPGIAVGQAVAEGLAVRAGDRLRLEGHDLLVTGIVKPTGVLMSHMLFMPLADMQRMFRRPSVVTIFNVRLAAADAAGSLAGPDRAGGFIARATQAFPDLSFSEARLIADQNPMLRVASALAWGVSAVALSMGLIGVINTLLMSVTERAREIGILSAVGWRATRILALIVSEGVLLALAGSLAGLAAGLAALRAIAASPHVAHLLELSVSPRLMVEVFLAALTLSAIASLYPAWRATRISPVDALKHD